MQPLDHNSKSDIYLDIMFQKLKDVLETINNSADEGKISVPKRVNPHVIVTEETLAFNINSAQDT